MKSTISDQIPQGEDLARAVFNVEELEYAQYAMGKIQIGLDAAKDLHSPRTAHADFMAELKAELLNKINAR